MGNHLRGLTKQKMKIPICGYQKARKKTKEKPTLFSKYSIIIDAFAHRFSAALYNAVFSFVSNRQKLRDLKC